MARIFRHWLANTPNRVKARNENQCVCIHTIEPIGSGWTRLDRHAHSMAASTLPTSIRRMATHQKRKKGEVAMCDSRRRMAHPPVVGCWKQQLMLPSLSLEGAVLQSPWPTEPQKKKEKEDERHEKKRNNRKVKSVGKAAPRTCLAGGGR